MKEKDLKELGFKKTKISAEQSGGTAFYYYTYTFKKHVSRALDLITSASDEIENGSWQVFIFDSGLHPLKKKSDVARYIKLIKTLGG